jgi:hypothetical protein
MHVIGDIISGTAMCQKCMEDAGHKRKDKGSHTAVLAHCTGCDSAKALLSIRHWNLKE